MKKYNYFCTTNTIWTSFDHCTVKAKDKEEALKKAKEELKYNLGKVNHVLASSDVTVDFTIEFDLSQIEIEEVVEKVLVYGSPETLTGKELIENDEDMYFTHGCGIKIHIECDYNECPICGGHLN